MSDKKHERNFELLKEYRAGDPAARELLIIENTRLVSAIAKRYTFNNKYEFDDLRQEGFFGLIKAIERFEPSYGVSFGNYAAYWIKQAILRYIYNCGRVIRLPVYLHEKIYVLKKAIEELTIKCEREPTSFELAKHLQISIYEAEKLILLKEDVESLDVPLTDEDGATTRLDTIQDEQESPEDIAERNDRVKRVSEAVMQLNERQREVIRRRYGFKCKAETLDSIGDGMGVSRARVQQIEKAALDKLRAIPELQVYRIEKKIDERTDFYKKTEKVVMWREQQREKFYKWNLDDLHTMKTM